MATDPLDVLKVLALRGADREFIPITSSQVAEKIGVSQQTASRKILDLLNRDLIDRRLGARVQLVKITEPGMTRLREVYEEYRAIFERPDQLAIHGTVETGLGKGKQFVEKDGYQRQFSQRLGFEPYPGTLNVRIDDTERGILSVLENTDGIEIDPFENGGTTYGGAKCFPALVREVEDCAVILPDRSDHDDVVEVISPTHLRSALEIDEGDPVEVRVKLR